MYELIVEDLDGFEYSLYWGPDPVIPTMLAHIPFSASQSEYGPYFPYTRRAVYEDGRLVFDNL